MCAKPRAPPPESTTPSERCARRLARRSTPAGTESADTMWCARGSRASSHRPTAAPVLPTSTSSHPSSAPSALGGRSSPTQTRRRSHWRRQNSFQGALPPSSRITNPFAFSASSRMTANDPGSWPASSSTATLPQRPSARVSSWTNCARSASPIVLSANTLGLVLLGSRPPLSCSCRASSRDTPAASSASVSIRLMNRSASISSSRESRTARTEAERGEPVSGASSPSVAPAPTSRSTRSSAEMTRRRPESTM